MKLPSFKKVSFNKSWNLVLAISRTALFSIACMVVLIGLMFYKLATLTPGLSEHELQTYQSASSVPAIIDNMVNAPYKAGIFVSTHIFESAFGLRMVGAIAGIAAVVVFYLIAKHIYTRLIALSITAMFASSTLLLAVSRVANGYVMFLSLLAIVGAGFYVRFGKRPDIAWIAAATVLGLSLYVPGMIFFVLAAVIWQFHRVKETFERLQMSIIIASSVLFGLLCAPLFISLVRDPGLWRAYAGFPAEFAGLLDMLKAAGQSVLGLFVVSQPGSSIWLGRQPVLDIFASVMFVIGLITIVKNPKLDRLWTLFGIFLLAIIWIGLSGNRYGIVLILPFVYFVVGFGLQKLMERWQSVFPKNPIARYCGAALVAVAIVASLNFQLHRYFVAWPNSDAAKAAFSHSLSGTE